MMRHWEAELLYIKMGHSLVSKGSLSGLNPLWNLELLSLLVVSKGALVRAELSLECGIYTCPCVPEDLSYC